MHKNAMCDFEQIQESTSHKTAAVRSPIFSSLKPFKSDEQDMRDTAVEIRVSS